MTKVPLNVIFDDPTEAQAWYYRLKDREGRFGCDELIAALCHEEVGGGLG